ncbi:hypothetical protein BH11PSE11_BH11PSE11_20170 [soil metagenome]
MKSFEFAGANRKFFCAALLLLASAAAQAAGIAFVTNLKGEPKIDGAKLTLLSELDRGQRIVCASECMLGVMYLQSGKEYEVKGPGEYLIGDNAVTAKIGVPPAVRETSWRISINAVKSAQTSSASIRMRGIPNSPQRAAPEKLTYPVKTMIATLTPLFQWEAADGKGLYEFELTAPGGKSIYKTRTMTNSMKLPANVKLQPDAEYAWSVSTSGSQLGSGNFGTLPAQSVEMASQRKPADNAQFNDWVAYALMLQEIGATQDAHVIWSRLAKERPDLPELAEYSRS